MAMNLKVGACREHVDSRPYEKLPESAKSPVFALPLRNGAPERAYAAIAVMLQSLRKPVGVDPRVMHAESVHQNREHAQTALLARLNRREEKNVFNVWILRGAHSI